MADRFPEVIEGILEGLESALKRAGDDEVEQIKQDIGIQVGYASGFIVRSEPGSPPRRETGELQESIYSVVTRPEPNVVQLAVGSTADYAANLEFGGPSNFGEVQPRPFMRPSMERFNAGGVWSVIEDLKQAK